MACGPQHRLNNLLLAIHPPAQFLNAVLVNNFDLIFITVVVRHVFSPLAGTKFGAVAHIFRACRFRRPAENALSITEHNEGFAEPNGGLPRRRVFQ